MTAIDDDGCEPGCRCHCHRAPALEVGTVQVPPGRNLWQELALLERAYCPRAMTANEARALIRWLPLTD